MLFCIIIVSGTFSAVVGQEINLELSVIERTVFQSSLSLIGIIQTQNLSWEWHLNISIIIFLVAWIQFFFLWNINHSSNILNGQKYKYKSSHNFNLNVNAIGTPSLRCNQNSHFSVFQSLTRYSLHNILLHGT